MSEEIEPLIEEILNVVYPSSVQLSPDAKQVLYSTPYCWGHNKDKKKVTKIQLVDTGHEDKLPTQLNSGTSDDRDPIWSPNGRWIAYISDRTVGSKSYALYIMDLTNGGPPYAITPTDSTKNIKNYKWSPDSHFIAYTQADERSKAAKDNDDKTGGACVWKNKEDWGDGFLNRLRIVNVETKEITTLVSDDNYTVWFDWNHDGSQIVIAQIPGDIDSQWTDGTKISIVNVVNKNIRPLCIFPSRTECLTWAEEDTIHFLGQRSPLSKSSSQMVYSIDVTATKPRYERCAHGINDCARQLGKAGKDLVIMVQNGMKDELRMLSGHTIFSAKQEILSWHAGFTTDSDEMIIAVSMGNSGSPPEVFTKTASGGATIRVSRENWIDHQFGKAHILKCQSDDDKVYLEALYVTPADIKSRPKEPSPTIVFPHGGPYARITDSFNPFSYTFSTVLVNQGYGVLFPNYRGSSGRGEAFAAAIRKERGNLDYADVITMTHYAIKDGWADPKRLVIAGWSAGGQLAFEAAVRNGLHGKRLHEKVWSFQGAIAGAGCCEADMMALMADTGLVEGGTERLPWECDKDDVSGRKSSALWESKKGVEKGAIPPMLIMHGEKDDRVPEAQAMGFKRALDSIEADFEMVTYPREGHHFKERRHIVDMLKRTVSFVEENIGKART